MALPSGLIPEDPWFSHPRSSQHRFGSPGPVEAHVGKASGRAWHRVRPLLWNTAHCSVAPRPPATAGSRLCPHPQGPKHPSSAAWAEHPACSVLCFPGEAASLPPHALLPPPGPLLPPKSQPFPPSQSPTEAWPTASSCCKPHRPAVSPAASHPFCAGAGAGASCCAWPSPGALSPPVLLLCLSHNSQHPSVCLPLKSLVAYGLGPVFPPDAGSRGVGAFGSWFTAVSEAPGLVPAQWTLLNFYLQTVHTQLCLFRADPPDSEQLVGQNT